MKTIFKSNAPSREERLIQLHKDIAVISNENLKVETAMKNALERVCREADWPVGHIYFISKNSLEDLVPSFLWYLKNQNYYLKLDKKDITRRIGIKND